MIDSTSRFHSTTLSEPAPTPSQVPSGISVDSALPLDPLETQYEPMVTTQQGITNQIFHFSSSELTRILCPKKPRDGVDTSKNFLHIEDYRCEVDEKAFEDALRQVVGRAKTFTRTSHSDERGYYRSLATFLTRCVKECHNALDMGKVFPNRRDRWYKDLEFVVGGPAIRGVGGATDLEPEIMGGAKETRKFKGDLLDWEAPKAKPAYPTMLPVEVKRDWTDMVSRAANYALNAFAASPMRVFTIVLAIERDSNLLRFLIFHRGGLAASQPHSITNAAGMREVARVFLTLALWSTAAEAGFVTCCDDTTYLLPADENGGCYVSAAVGAVAFRSLHIYGHMAQVFLLHLSAGIQPAALQPLAKTLVEPSVVSVVRPRRSKRLVKPRTKSSHPGGSRGRISRDPVPMKGEHSWIGGPGMN